MKVTTLRRQLSTSLVAHALLIVVLTLALLRAPHTFAEPDPGQTDSSASKLLELCFDALAAQPKIAVSFANRMTIQSKESRTVVEMGYSLALQRPDRLAFRSSKAKEGIDIVTDGQRAYSSAHRAKEFSIFDPPEELSALIPSSEHWDALNDWFLPAVCSSDAAKRALSVITEIRELEAGKVDGVDCRRLEIRSNRARWEVFASAGQQPRFRKLVWEVLPMKGSDDPYHISLETKLTDWDFQPKFGDETFSFKPAPGWKRVKDSLATSSAR